METRVFEHSGSAQAKNSGEKEPRNERAPDGPTVGKKEKRGKEGSRIARMKHQPHAGGRRKKATQRYIVETAPQEGTTVGGGAKKTR